MLDYFNQMIKPLSDELGEMLDGEAMVNSFPNWKENGITHVHVLDRNIEYELVNGEWVEKAPF